MLRVAMPPGNRVRGRLPRAASINATIVKLIRNENADALARLMGGSVARRRRKAKTRRTRGSLALAGLVERRVPLRAVYKGKTYKAALRKDGQIGYGGRLYESPTAAGKAILKRPVNGWLFWQYRKGRKSWARLRELKG